MEQKINCTKTMTEVLRSTTNWTNMFCI